MAPASAALSHSNIYAQVVNAASASAPAPTQFPPLYHSAWPPTPLYAYPQHLGMAESSPSSSVREPVSAGSSPQPHHTLNLKNHYENHNKNYSETIPAYRCPPQPFASSHNGTGPVPGPSHRRHVPETVEPDPPLASFNAESGQDILSRLFLSLNPRENLFHAKRAALSRLAGSHHLEIPENALTRDIRHALITHFLAGGCLAVCNPETSPAHSCQCHHLRSSFVDTRSMAFYTQSILVSASVETFPHSAVEIVGTCFGFEDLSRENVLYNLARQRRILLKGRDGLHTVDGLFNSLERLPKGTLLVLSKAHGLRINASKHVLQDAIVRHISTGKSVRHEEYSFSCSAVESEFSDCAVDTGSSEDPSTRLQISILKQLCPVLKLTALRRLLRLHDVPFVDSDKTKKLRRRLKSYLTRLRSGKQFESELTSTDIARAARAKESARLRSQWPQVIPDHLKKQLLKNFNFEISRDNLATFVCGSCTEECPFKLRSTIGLDDFDINLLKRPDEFIDIHAPEQPDDDDSMDVDSTENNLDSRSHTPLPNDPASNDTASTSNSGRDDPDPDSPPNTGHKSSTREESPDAGSPSPEIPPTSPWLDPKCPEPPMPMSNTPFASLLIDPSNLEADPETNDPVVGLVKNLRRTGENIF
ncbi:hypothetical protein B0H16DRAFT_1734570 [Mycena metata]|uniref:Uncharacterized protein n=1 Tax=Mycena metata TaxID=1033252 RepID=A0AAD7MSB4_9AGAR|nr:hypothetical protein B0H16DRAFT_1734570 [Mycena metata]